MKTLSTLAILAFLFAMPVRAASYSVNWGLEQFRSCTNLNFAIELRGTNPDGVYLKRISGNISGNTNAGANSTAVTRAALVSIFNPTLAWATPPAAVVTMTPEGMNHGVVNAFGAFILKQTSAVPAQVMVNIVFDVPVKLPGNALWFGTQVQSYGDGLPNPDECMDVEAQLLVQFQD